MNGTNKTLFLANLIRIFHWTIIAFILLAPFSNIPSLLILHITFSSSLLIHWINNNNMCSLSIMESKLRGLDYTESLTHKFISPLYDVSKTTWSSFCYVITILLACFSAYLLLNSKALKTVRECTATLRKSDIYMSASFSKKMQMYAQCLRPLFVF